MILEVKTYKFDYVDIYHNYVYKLHKDVACQHNDEHVPTNKSNVHICHHRVQICISLLCLREH